MKELSTTSYAILGLLCVRPFSAYELAKQMQLSLRFAWPRAISGVYEEPKKLVAHGLASAHRDGGRRTKVIYSATPKGRRAFRRWLAQPSAPPQFESEALLRSVFAEHGTKDDLVATLRALRSQVDSERRHGADLVGECLATGGPFPHRLHVIALATRFLADYNAMLGHWARWAEAEVQKWPDTRQEGEVADAIERYRSIIGDDLVEELHRLDAETASAREA